MRNASFILAVLISATASACPVCSSETAEEVRSELVDENLGVSVVAIVSPFVVAVGTVVLVQFLPDGARRRR